MSLHMMTGMGVGGTLLVCVKLQVVFEHQIHHK